MFKSIFKQKSAPDFTLLVTVFLLLSIGIIMVYSSSHIWAIYKYNDQFYFVKRQVLFVTVGLITMFIMVYIPYQFWHKYVGFILIACFLLLLLVLIPGLGLVRGGAQSWIGVGAFSIQPSEFMKLGIILFLASFLERKQRNIQDFNQVFLPSMLIISIAFGLIMLQPDLGTGVVLVLTAVLMLFISGVNIGNFIGLSLLGISGLTFLIFSAPYRISRITSFLNPWEDPLGDGFQIIQSLYAIGPGKLMGLGLGKSLQKYFYLPEPQTDFIFSIIAEELGFIGGTFVVILFGIMFWRGIKIALEADSKFGTYIAFGITAMIIIQVMINISVVIGLIPVTGITLPFLSYGGSSLTLTLCSIGLLLSVSR